MKTILLLAFTVMVSSVPLENSDKKLLGELIDELEREVKRFSKDNEGNEIYLTELRMNGCKSEFFCQAEQELLKEVSGRSGAKFEHFRTDKTLMKNLHKYNQCYGKTCKPAHEDQEIRLGEFLKNLLTCVQNLY
ncbi:interleukin-13 [Carassius carassius]|uniref:interleukin-13 n=1 Tax=Carassius carassius TaxID=217509 RepID=UPI002868403C|nr:interleukin-13 [Carassius carassius]